MRVWLGPRRSGVEREARFSGDAETDLLNIAVYTAERFGRAQEQKYRDDLWKAIAVLVDFPRMGADQERIAKGLRRHVHVAHAIYYSEQSYGVLVERILGPGQDPMREFGG